MSVTNRRLLAMAFAVTTSMLAQENTWAGTTCDLPAAFSLTVEESSGLGGVNERLTVVRSGAPSTSLRPGDVIRQANDRRTLRCADLEAVAVVTRAKGLVLLLAAEREGQLFALALPSAPSESAIGAAPPGVAGKADAPTADTPVAAAPVVVPPVTRPTPVPSPVARAAALPARADASAELAAKAVAAAAVLGAVDEAARLVVPLATYERRIDEARNAIAALHIEGEGSAAVRDVVAEIFGYHDTARDIRRYKAAELSHSRVDQRGAAAISLPYFSDSQVPGWVARYPFLDETLQQAPRATHMLLPGEMAGRWNPDQAVELLWERAAETATRLGTWGGNK
ncbi:MAG: hypothetical protein ABIR79_04350 [Candidatus Binatia bacterium]